MHRSNLKVVESVPFYRKEVSLWKEDGIKEAHSLHSVISHIDATPPETVAYLISKYSQPGQVVFDPCCGSGTTLLEANLIGRIAYGSDVDPLSIRLSKAKVSPADITEVTLALQQVNLRRPVETKLYREIFGQFYDLDTYREIVNLKTALGDSRDHRIGRFIEAVTSSLLHGHTAGFFSVYTFPHVSLSVSEQEKINIQRRQIPDYRAVVPRVLRKTASVLRDGVPNSQKQTASKNRIIEADGRNVSSLPTGSVDLLLTNPPQLGDRKISDEWWLRFWFSDIDRREVDRRTPAFSSDTAVEEWIDFMNELLMEGARVVRGGGRAAIILRSSSSKPGRGGPDKTEEEFIRMVNESFARFWDVEGVLVNSSGGARIKDAMKPREGERGSKPNRVVILRRR